MAAVLNSRQEIAQMREAGRILAETYEVLRPNIVPGTTTAQLDRIAEEFIRSKGATPAYVGYGARPARARQPAIPPFPATICVAVNDVICHAIPNTHHHLQTRALIRLDIRFPY